ncbi:MAG: HD domain-containing protein [Solirubrobacteraceae bacterium]|nr:HD domain-containing protein [Solirubrobacteraceae bacterium]
MTDALVRPRPGLAVGIAGLLLASGVAGFAFTDHGDLLEPTLLVLLVVGLGANLIDASYSGRLSFSPAFTCGMIAVAFLGPASAFAVPVVAELAAWGVQRYRWRALVINLAGAATPTLLAAMLVAAASPPAGSATFYALLGAVTVGVFLLNFGLVVSLMALLDGTSAWQALQALTGLIPTVVLSIALTLAVAAAYVELGTAALALLLVAIAAVAYMTRLVVQSREQTRQYASLSWGVLSALVRTLDERDHRAARHCAAVAMFSRDIARAAGLAERDQELAHTAGLLHDIGKFVLSDRVMERGAQLSESDWRGIRRHPDIGADLLSDIGVFGPVGEIVRCHHERIDGRGYPRGLRGEQIPEIARIVAIAEVYDTLTAPDTYRTPMTSFEALNELRRVSGTQLDGHLVEVLAELLAGRGTDYRHQDEADFDRELDMERRMSEAASPG